SAAGELVYNGGGQGATDRGLTINAGGGTVDCGTQNIGFGGIVSGPGNLTKAGAGTLSLGGALNTMSGSFNVNAGTLSVGSIGAGERGANVNLIGGSTFEYTGANHTNSRGVSITGSGTIGVTNASSTLTLNGAVNGPTLAKSGAGTLNLGGLVTYTGTTHAIAANSGTIAYGSSGGNTINGTYTVNSGSTLRTTASNGLGAVSVALSGGRLSLAATPAIGGGLVGEFYQFGPNS